MVSFPRDDGAPSHSNLNAEPLGGMITSVIVTVVATTILSSFITQRSLAIKNWSRLPFVVWLVFAIFIDSWIFVFVTAILKFGLGLATSFTICQAAILLCLVCYVTTKILIYMFLVEKAYIIRKGPDPKPRMKSKLYLFNSFGMLGVYLIVSILNFVFRITRLEEGQCIIGMKRIAMIPLITFDILVNIYLTILFLIPLRSLYSFRGVQRNPANERLRTVAMRTFIGAFSTTVSSVVNLSVLMGLDGEPGWVCLMCCNFDIAFSAIVIHWVTSKDNAGTSGSSSADQWASRDGERGTNQGRHISVRDDSIDLPRRGSTMKSPSSNVTDVEAFGVKITHSFGSEETRKPSSSGGESIEVTSTESIGKTTERVGTERRAMFGIETTCTRVEGAVEDDKHGFHRKEPRRKTWRQRNNETPDVENASSWEEQQVAKQHPDRPQSRNSKESTARIIESVEH